VGAYSAPLETRPLAGSWGKGGDLGEGRAGGEWKKGEGEKEGRERRSIPQMKTLALALCHGHSLGRLVMLKQRFYEARFDTSCNKTDVDC